LEKKVLVIVDAQNDFFENGVKPVNNAKRIIPTLKKFIDRFNWNNQHIILTRQQLDYKLFKKEKPYALEFSDGGEIINDLRIPKVAIHADRGFDKFPDSIVDDEFLGLLDELGAEKVYIGGINVNNNLVNSILDLVKNKYKVGVLVDAIATDSSTKVLDLIRGKGVELIR
jgi:nicotinamidase/pyrazinamidase